MKKLQIKKNKNLDNRKFNNGITLIALVVTVIILLILAGIGIGALGSDGLIQKARDAREQAEIDNEKEIVETSVIQAVAKNRYGNIEKAGLETYLDVNTGEGNTVEFCRTIFLDFCIMPLYNVTAIRNCLFIYFFALLIPYSYFLYHISFFQYTSHS